MTERKKALNEETVLRMLDTLYDKSLQGIPGISVPVEELAAEYIAKITDPELAAKKMLNNQIAKCTTSGVITGLGGVLTLPVTIPANVSSILYMYIRMIACTATLAGNDLTTDKTRALVYACLAGVSAESLQKRATKAALETTRTQVASCLAQRIGEKSLLNLVKLIPVIGAGVNGGLDFLQSRIVADRAFRLFFEGGYTFEDEPSLKEKGQAAFDAAKDLFQDAASSETGQKAIKKATEIKDTIKEAFFSGDKDTVYVSASGKSYHTDITHAGKDPIPMTRAEAEAQGYTPCKRCIKE